MGNTTYVKLYYFYNYILLGHCGAMFTNTNVSRDFVEFGLRLYSLIHAIISSYYLRLVLSVQHGEMSSAPTKFLTQKFPKNHIFSDR